MMMVECSIANPEPDWIGIQSSEWIRILYGGLGMSLLKLLIQNFFLNSAINFLNPDPESMNPDPQHWLNELPNKW
jgi:hypothetical protein